MTNLQGLNVSGLNFHDDQIRANKIDIPYTIKQHKYGAEATWSHCTDTYRPTLAGKGIDAEINAFKYNLALTVFVSSEMVTAPDSALKSLVAGGRSKIGVYEYTGQLYETGEVSDNNYPSFIKKQYNYIKDILGYNPSVAVYGYGRQTFKDVLKNHYLAVRNSAYNVDNYGYDITDTSSFPTTTRQADMPGERNVVLQECSTALSNAISNNGWYRDFTHWHNTDGTDMADYFESQRNTIGNQNVVTLDFMTAIEYMKFRQFTNGINFYEKDSKVYVQADIGKNEVMRKNISTSLSVEVDLTGTILENSELKSNEGVQKVSANKYIVEAPPNGYAVLESDADGRYLSFKKPVITSYFLGGNFSVKTDINTKLTLFRVPVGEGLFNAEIMGRSVIFDDNHTLKIGDTTGYDLHVGLITETGQSTLIKL